MSSSSDTFPQPTFGRFLPVMRAHGFGRTFSYDLQKKGLIKTFRIGRATFIELDSLRTLPERIAAGRVPK